MHNALRALNQPAAGSDGRASARWLWMGVCAALLFCGCRTFRSQPVDAQLAQARQLTCDGLNELYRGNLTRAEQMLLQAVEFSPGDPRIRKHLADALARRGEHQLAIGQLQQALESAQDDPELHVAIGDLYLKTNRASSAVTHAEMALAANRHLAAAWALKGRAQLARNEHQDALACLHRALGCSGADPQIALDVARVYRKMDRPGQALAALESLANQLPADQLPAEFLMLQGQSLVDLGQLESAIERLSRAASSDQATPEIYRQLCDAQRKAGNIPNARLTALAAMDRFPRDPQVARLMDELQHPVSDELARSGQ